MSKDVQLLGFTRRLGVRHRYVESALLLLDGNIALISCAKQSCCMRSFEYY
jgi:hypothetical protein